MQNRYSFFVIHFENKTMVRRCCVPKCTGNSNEENKERVFKFPIRTKKRKHGERPSRGPTFLHLILQLYVKGTGLSGYEITAAHGRSTAKKSPIRI